MLKIILSENFEKFQSKNRVRYSNEFFTETFIEKISTKRKIFVKYFQRIQKLGKN